MQPPIEPVTDADIRQQILQLYRSRLAYTVPCLLLGVVGFAAFDVVVREAPVMAVHVLQVLQTIVLVSGWWWLRGQRTLQQLEVFCLGLVASLYLSIAAAGVVAATDAATPVLFSALTMGSAVLMPWRLSTHVASVAIGAAALLWSNAAVNGPWSGTALAPLAAALLSFSLSPAMVWILWRERRHRFELYHRLHSRDEQLQRIFSGLQDIYFQTKLDGTIALVSPSVEQYGVRAEDLIGQRVQDFYGDPSEREENVLVLLEEQVVRDREVRLVGPDGREAVFSGHEQVVRDLDGTVIGFEGLLRDVTERKRFETQQQEAAEIAEALAWVGGELIGSLNQPTLLERLCELTVTVFECDVSTTFLLADDGESLLVAAGAGHSPEAWESLRPLVVPRSMVEPLLERIEREGITQVLMDDSGDLPTVSLSRKYGLTMSAYFPLRRGDEIVGFQSIGFQGRSELLPEARRRLAVRVADLASLALEAARLTEELQAESIVRERFLGNMSHELRTPLNVILGYIEMLLDGEFGELSSEQQQTVEITRARARDLLRLMETTLEISRYEARELPLSLDAGDFGDWWAETERDLATISTPENVTVDWRLRDNPGWILMDWAKLGIVVSNLFNNAAKYTSDGAIVVSAAVGSEGNIEVVVEDTGIGMTDQVIDKIFEPFLQAEHTSVGGVGLGLYIVQRLVDALGGDIEVDSQLGEGAKFTVRVPFSRAELSAVADA